MSIRWTQPTASGLGDRLMDLVHLLAYCRVRKQDLHTSWAQFLPKDIDTAHRVIDIKLENVVAHITLPPDLVFTDSKEGEWFNYAIGGDVSVHEFWAKHLKNTCSMESFAMSLAGVLGDITFCPDINDVLGTLPRNFAAVHIRRGDKVRDEEPDCAFIHRRELAELDRLTYKALDTLRFDTFFLCGDEDHKTAPFRDHLLSHGKRVLGLPDMEKWRQTYFDLAVMSRARAVVTSTRYSAFSRFAALLGGATWATAFMLT